LRKQSSSIRQDSNLTGWGRGAAEADRLLPPYDIDRASEEMDRALERGEYGNLVLSQSLGRSRDLGRRFALHLRAELGRREEIETLAIELFNDLPDLNPEAVVRGFLDERAG
jgi:hypothetical protein